MIENGAETGKNGTFFGFLVGAPRVLEWDVTKRAGIVAQIETYAQKAWHTYNKGGGDSPAHSPNNQLVIQTN